jgi:hypothetical protein
MSNSTNKKYEILQWDAQKTCKTWNSFDVSFYFVPDIELLNIIQENKHVIQIEINDTNSIYDGMKFLATIDRLDSKPNGRPNFDITTHAYIATIPIAFTGFPEKKGTFQVIYGPYDIYNSMMPSKKSKQVTFETMSFEAEPEPNPEPPIDPIEPMYPRNILFFVLLFIVIVWLIQYLC